MLWRVPGRYNRMTPPAGSSGFVRYDAAQALSASQQSQARTNIGAISAGFANKFRNGTMDVWQRGTAPITVSTSGAYTADGWIVTPTGASVTAQQGAGAGLTLNSLKVTGNASVTGVTIKQRIESYIAARFGGQTVTVQAKVYNGTGAAITPTLTVRHANSVDGWGASTTDLNAVSLQSCANGVYSQVAYTFVADAGSYQGLEIVFDFGNNFSTNSKYVQLAECDIRVTPGITTGLNSAPPDPELRPIFAEYLFNYRYFYSTYGGTAPGSSIGSGYAGIGSQQGGAFAFLAITLVFPLPMRATPTMTIYDDAGASGKISYYTGSWNNNGAALVNSVTNMYSGIGVNSISGTSAISFMATASAEL